MHVFYSAKDWWKVLLQNKLTVKRLSLLYTTSSNKSKVRTKRCGRIQWISKAPNCRKTLAGRPKTTWLSLTLNDINIHTDVKLAAILREKQESNSKRTRYRQTWKTFFGEKDLWMKMVVNIMYMRQTNVHYTYITYVRATGIEI